MTREEAIRILNRLSPTYKGTENDSAYLIGEALTMAIKALEQEPKFIAKADGTIEQIKNCNDCLFRKEWKKIGKLLSVILEKHSEQEPRKGHWIDREVYDADRWKCSECGRTEQWKENFCPNCGADMRGRYE